MQKLMFRGKDVKTGEWIVGDGIHFPKSERYNGTCWIDGMAKQSNDWVQVEAGTVGIWTGQYDKNKKMIFEGDILRGYWGTKFTVVYDEDYLQFIAKGINFPARELSYFGNYSYMVVIGNIFDNPEILEEK